MKLQSVEYNATDESWHSIEYIPSNPRSIILYTLEGGSAEGKYENGNWIQYRWNCTVIPKFWREMPRCNECKNCL